jgi:hypothetical protein
MISQIDIDQTNKETHIVRIAAFNAKAVRKAVAMVDIILDHHAEAEEVLAKHKAGDTTSTLYRDLRQLQKKLHVPTEAELESEARAFAAAAISLYPPPLKIVNDVEH